MIDILLILLALLSGYILFMASFYLLVKLIFRKVNVSEEQEYLQALELLEEKRRKQTRYAKRSRSYGLTNQAA